MTKFGQKFSDFFVEYENLFDACGVDIAETRAFDATVANSVRLPSDNLRKALVRFRKTYVYISEKELTKEKCGNNIMKKYRKNVSIRVSNRIYETISKILELILKLRDVEIGQYLILKNY